MNIITRQIMVSVLSVLLILFILAVGFFYSFPLTDWSLLWKQKIMDVPFIVVIPSLTIVLGIAYGVITGLSYKAQLRSVSEGLQHVEEGRQIELDKSYQENELQVIFKRMEKIRNTMAEQVKLSQKLATEKAEEQEKRIQEIVSQERNRLARELHDSVSQQLFAASMLMSAITEMNATRDSAEAKQLKLVEGMIHQSQLEMRALLLHLRPVALKGKTLQDGINELCLELLQKVPMDITWKVEDMTLDKGVEDHLFRILQESVSNTLRHAKSTKLEILLILRDGMVILRIVDNGIGFDVETSKTGSYGLQNMYERAVEIGGTLKIVSIKDKGTRLEVKVPMMS